MAVASGEVTIRTISVNYNGTRGNVASGGKNNQKGISMVSHLGWTVDENNVLRLTYNYDEGQGAYSLWRICGSASGYGVESKVMFRPTGGDWQTLKYVFKEVCKCANCMTNTHDTLVAIAAEYGDIQLTAPGELKITYGANRAPAPSYNLPISFPSETISQSDQVSIYIPVETDYRPGQRKVNGTWESLNRDGGVCYRKGYGEMKTDKGGQETDNPPSIKTSGLHYNMKKIGANQ